MRIVWKRRLREFWESRKHDAAIAERDLSAWYKTTKNADWDNFASLRQTFGSADQVGNCVVFDVGNNRFRLIGRVNYGAGIVYVLRVMDHEEYDKQLDRCVRVPQAPADQTVCGKENSSEGEAETKAREVIMAVTTTRTMPDTYFQLVQRFPLAHIKDEEGADAAQAMIDELLQKELDAGEQAYLDVLTDLFEVYEDEHVSIPDASEADVLRGLMTANGLSQPALAKKVGIAQSTISAVLNGSRSLTKDQVLVLAKFFRVAPGAFLSS